MEKLDLGLSEIFGEGSNKLTATITVKADAGGVVSLDGSDVAHVKSGEPHQIECGLGQHIIRVSSETHPDVFKEVTQDIETPGRNYLVVIDGLSAEVERRLKKVERTKRNKKRGKKVSSFFKSLWQDEKKRAGLIWIAIMCASLGFLLWGLDSDDGDAGKDAVSVNEAGKDALSGDVDESVMDFSGVKDEVNKTVEDITRSIYGRLGISKVDETPDEIDISNLSFRISKVTSDEMAIVNGIRGISISYVLTVSKPTDATVTVVLPLYNGKKEALNAVDGRYTYRTKCAILDTIALNEKKQTVTHFIPFKSMPRFPKNAEGFTGYLQREWKAKTIWLYFKLMIMDRGIDGSAIYQSDLNRITVGLLPDYDALYN